MACWWFAWIWRQSWGQWKYQNNTCIRGQCLWSWLNEPNHLASPVKGGWACYPCRAHEPQSLCLDSPLPCWGWRETGLWHRFLSSGCPGFLCVGCPQNQQGPQDTASLSAVGEEEHTDISPPKAINMDKFCTSSFKSLIQRVNKNKCQQEYISIPPPAHLTIDPYYRTEM